MFSFKICWRHFLNPRSIFRCYSIIKSSSVTAHYIIKLVHAEVQIHLLHKELFSQELTTVIETSLVTLSTLGKISADGILK